MLKKIIFGLSITLILACNVQANQLQKDMQELLKSLNTLQGALYTNNKKETLAATLEFKKVLKNNLSDKDKIESLLPENLKYKASIAISSAEMIDRNLDKISKTIKNRDLTMIKKQMLSQKSFIEIHYQCFRCHNLVRDWE